MRTTITLPDPVLENAKQRARERGITLSEFVAEAVQRHVVKQNTSGERPPFRLITVSGKALPGVDLSRPSALIVEDDEEQYKDLFRG
jgi:hypothetical protein